MSSSPSLIASSRSSAATLLRSSAVVPFPAVVHVDRYVVHGLLHAPQVRNPLREAASRPWLPLTEAVLEHQPAGVPVRERYEGLLVNRSHTHAIVRTDAAALQSHERAVIVRHDRQRGVQWRY